MKDLLRYVDTPFVLLVQWDGFVLDAGCWDERLRTVDYAGAQWPTTHGPAVGGNGGFSWRSRRLLCALADPDIVSAHPEDLQIHSYRSLLEQRHGIQFASADIADRFSQEYRVDEHIPSFGFHSLARFQRVLDPRLAAAFLSRLPLAQRGSTEAVALAVAYANAGMPGVAAALADIIRTAEPAGPFRELLMRLNTP